MAPGELTVLVEGEVELKGQIEMDVSIRGDGESKALTTHCSRPGTCLNSFMDILEHVPQKWSAPGESPAAPAKSSDAPSSGQKSPRSESADRVRVRLSFGAEKEEHQRDRVRVSARAAPGGCVLAVVKMSDFHECAGAVVGIQAVSYTHLTLPTKA